MRTLTTIATLRSRSFRFSLGLLCLLIVTTTISWTPATTQADPPALDIVGLTAEQHPYTGEWIFRGTVVNAAAPESLVVTFTGGAETSCTPDAFGDFTAFSSEAQGVVNAETSEGPQQATASVQI